VHDARPVERKIGRRGSILLGAIADQQDGAPPRIAFVEKSAQRFAAAKVDAVAVLGDLGRTEDEIARVLLALRAANAPVLAIAGERESENAFHAAVNQARNAGLDVIDLVERRLVSTDDIDIVSVPGYPFTNRGCRYRARDLDGVRALVRQRDKTRVILGHMPPRGEGEAALDRSWGATNVGDRNVRALVEELRPALGLFAHVDEAMGQVEKTETRLLLNVGIGPALVRLTDGKATLEALP
jgi:Icc-related predicted phosphoesterase